MRRFGLSDPAFLAGLASDPLAGLPAGAAAVYVGGPQYLWADLARTVPVAPGGTVAVWDDGNGRHMTQSNALLRPTWDGTNVVFGGSHWLSAAASWLSVAGPSTVGANLPAVTPGQYGVWGFGTTGAALSACGPWVGLSGTNWSVQFAGGHPYNTATATGPCRLIVARPNAAPVAATKVYTDGLLAATVSASAGTPTGSVGPLHVGCWADYTAGILFTGSVGRMAAYDRLLTEAETAQLDVWLAAKL